MTLTPPKASFEKLYKTMNVKSHWSVDALWWLDSKSSKRVCTAHDIPAPPERGRREETDHLVSWSSYIKLTKRLRIWVCTASDFEQRTKSLWERAIQVCARQPPIYPCITNTPEDEFILAKRAGGAAISATHNLYQHAWITILFQIQDDHGGRQDHAQIRHTSTKIFNSAFSN